MNRSASLTNTEISLTLDEWRASIARSFSPMDVAAVPSTPSQFHASIHRQQLGSVGVSRVISEAHVAERTERNVSLQPADYYKITCQIAGECQVTQDGRKSLLEPGNIAINDTVRPYKLTFPAANECLVLQVPRAEIPIDSAQIARLTGLPFSRLGGLTESLVEYLSLVSKSEAPAGSTVRYHLSRSLIELVTAALTAELGGLRTTAPAANALHSSIKRFALAHLSDPTLTLEHAAAAHYVSTRTAQRLFSAEGSTFVTWIRAERLERAQQQLLTSEHPITQIAMDVGFSSATHFSRAFREHFGISARNLRVSHAP